VYDIGTPRLHTSAYVSIRQHTSAYASIRQVPPACTPGHWGYFVSGASDGDIKIWDLEALEVAAADDLDASTVAGSACVQHLSDCHDKSPQPLGTRRMLTYADVC
jgi:WD40 repeat protein